MKHITTALSSSTVPDVITSAKEITLSVVSCVTITSISLSQIDVIVGIVCNVAIAAATIFLILKKARKINDTPDGK